VPLDGDLSEELTPPEISVVRGVAMSWKQQAQRVHREAQVFYFAFKHRGVPWHAKLVAACSAGYLFSPIQLIPSFIPVLGFSDDFLVLFLGAKLIQRIIPSQVLTECRELAEASAMQREDEISSPAVVAVVVIAAVWIAAAVSASVVMARYISF
jgi:uncharacterized membrane protein YkvA (DUF1232 family)